MEKATSNFLRHSSIHCNPVTRKHKIQGVDKNAGKKRNKKTVKNQYGKLIHINIIDGAVTQLQCHNFVSMASQCHLAMN